MSTVAEAFGMALRNHQAGNLRQAEQLYRHILKIDPHHAETHHLLGVLAFQTGNCEQAVTSIQYALSLDPQAAVYHSNLGLANQSLGKFDEAVGNFQDAIRCRSGFAEAHNNLGALLFQMGRGDEAIPHYAEALRLRPSYAETYNNLGNMMMQQGNLEEAIAKYNQAATLNPQFADAHNNLAVAYQKQGRLAEAVAECHHALRLQPNFCQAHNNMGMALRLQGKWDEATAQFKLALKLKPDYADPRFNLALAALIHGDFERGWPEYESRSSQVGFRHRNFAQPLWDGSDLGGKTILLYAEQGLGDSLQFIRYVDLVQQRGGKVVVECQPALLRLLATVSGNIELVAQGADLPPFDFHAPLLSLPRIFHTSLGSIPARVPYLSADVDLTERWRHKLVPIRRQDLSAPKFLIGIAWQGNPGFLHDRMRSIPVSYFARLAAVQGTQLISLQKGGTNGVAGQGSGVSDKAGEHGSTADSSALTPDPLPLIDFGEDLDASGAFMDTAAIMKNLDLVISSDTAVAHLAGALGVPVWLALALAPDWRWLLHREDSPWYPTMRLFRQSRVDDWDDVFERMAQELKKTAQMAKKIGDA